MTTRLSTAGLARISALYPWRVLGIWLLVLVAAVVLASGLGDVLTTESNLTSNPESMVADDLLQARLWERHDEPLAETVIITSAQLTIDDPHFRQIVEQTTADLAAMDETVASATNYYENGETSLVSADGHTTLIPITLTDSPETGAYIDAVTAHRDPAADIDVLTIGETTVSYTFDQMAQEDLPRGEAIGVGVGLIILIVVLGTLVAAGLPILLGIVSIVIALGLAAVIGRIIDLSIFVENIISMIGLAVGIDYALFVVDRYRQERRRGVQKIDAITIAGATASKAVLFSGITVILALCGMFFVPISIFRSLGIGSILVVLVAIAATLTFVPAVLSLLGDKIEWPRKRAFNEQVLRGHEGANAAANQGFWGRITAVVMAHPIIAVVLVGGMLIATAIPFTDFQRGEAGGESLPDSDAKTAFVILEREFDAGRLSPVQIVIDGMHKQSGEASVEAAIERLSATLAVNPAFARIESPQWNAAGDLALVNAWLADDAASPAAYAAVTELREDFVPTAFGSANAQVYISGKTAENLDYFAAIDTATPRVFIFVLGLSFLLLTLVFRSIVIPIKALIMNLLSVGATYGLLVLVFQKGYGAGLLGLQQTPVITAWVPIFLFCILFGLSMDYHVFMLSRIREHYDATGNNRESVAVGLRSTARMITGAALIMVVVFSGFATGRLVDLQQMGFGLAVAILIDATLIRTVLVPASMALLGDRNWYFPRWLGWLPNLGETRRDTTATTPTDATVVTI